MKEERDVGRGIPFHAVSLVAIDSDRKLAKRSDCNSVTPVQQGVLLGEDAIEEPDMRNIRYPILKEFPLINMRETWIRSKKNFSSFW